MDLAPVYLCKEHHHLWALRTVTIICSFRNSSTDSDTQHKVKHKGWFTHNSLVIYSLHHRQQSYWTMQLSDGRWVVSMPRQHFLPWLPCKYLICKKKMVLRSALRYWTALFQSTKIMVPIIKLHLNVTLKIIYLGCLSSHSPEASIW